VAEDITEPLNVQDVIGSQAYSVAARFKGFVDQEDLQQVGWVWCLEHQDKVNDHLENEDVKLAAYRLGQDIWNDMDRYSRKQKASASGYQPDDDLFVSDAVINLVLPHVLKDDPNPPVKAQERTKSTADPAEGGVWLATYLDVKTGWEKADLTQGQRDLLYWYYAEEYTQAELARSLEVGQQAIASRLKRARSKIIDQLGGRRPRDADTEYRSRPGTQGPDDAVLAALH
jgi:hypothetical protein